jgi:ketosteroid isomerase-like protein
VIRQALRAVPLMLLAVVAGCSGHRLAVLSPSDVATVIHRYDSAWNGRDTAMVNALLAPDYVYFSSRGGLTERPAALSMLAAPGYVLQAATRSDVVVTHSSPGLVVVSSRWRGHGTWQGEPFRDYQRCSLVLRQTGAQWQVLAEHCTQIPGPPPVPPNLALKLPPGPPEPASCRRPLACTSA